MSTKPIFPRHSARSDVDKALDFYLLEANQAVALGFIDALERAYRLISEQPGVGANRYAHALDLPGLRSWPLREYPYVVFYFEQDMHIEVWRVLHAASDIPTWMSDGV